MAILHTIHSSSCGLHSHADAYATVVLSGGFEEAGDQGRFRVEARGVLLHDRFEGHINRYSLGGAVVLNLPIPLGYSILPGGATVMDPDAIVRLAERSPTEAARALLSTLTFQTPATMDWPDALALALIANPSLYLVAQWAEDRGLKPWTLSRGFVQVFALSPSAFRARSRARLAWKTITANKEPFAKIAADLGFADQAHMTRSVRQLTGKSPRVWRDGQMVQNAEGEIGASSSCAIDVRTSSPRAYGQGGQGASSAPQSSPASMEGYERAEETKAHGANWDRAAPEAAAATLQSLALQSDDAPAKAPRL
jgi:AraC-like DNA-binding protein